MYAYYLNMKRFVSAVANNTHQEYLTELVIVILKAMPSALFSQSFQYITFCITRTTVCLDDTLAI